MNYWKDYLLLTIFEEVNNINSVFFNLNDD